MSDNIIDTAPPTPADMPAKKPAPVEVPPPAENTTPANEPDTNTGLTAEERDELDRLRNFRKQSRDWEKTAKQNFEDAQRFRSLVEQLGGKQDSGEADPLAEVNKLRSEIESERRERLRERVARETGVPPTQITGSDEESMKQSAAQALSWAQEFVKQAGKPLAAPASTVTADGKPHDERAGQIKTRDELKTMTPQEITAAYKDGRLDHLMGKHI